ncbi:MAG TPA: alpha/beta hydrolase [Trinickia sp.]|nr:alpha/beta hydrolase [Trinickia sp.]
MSWVLDKRYDFQGQAVRYSVQGDGPPLVFVHGTPFSSYVWRRIVPYFCATHTVYCYDLLGYGQSEQRGGQDVSLGIQNLLFAQLLDHWGIERPDVVAHDFGGATALRTHLLGGKDFRSLTLIDPVALSPWGSPLVRHVRRHEAAFSGLPDYVHEAIVPAYIRGATKRSLPDEELDPYVRPWLGDRGKAAFYRQIAQMDERYTDEVAPLYPTIRCPVSIIWGADDLWIPVEDGRRLRQAIPHSVLHVVGDAGHLVQEDAPEAIVAVLLGFLNEPAQAMAAAE